MIWDMTLDTRFWLSTSIYLPDEHGRNIETIIGSKVAGQGVSYVIHFYGSQTLTPILPWIK